MTKKRIRTLNTENSMMLPEWRALKVWENG